MKWNGTVSSGSVFMGKYNCNYRQRGQLCRRGNELGIVGSYVGVVFMVSTVVYCNVMSTCNGIELLSTGAPRSTGLTSNS